MTSGTSMEMRLVLGPPANGIWKVRSDSKGGMIAELVMSGEHRHTLDVVGTSDQARKEGYFTAVCVDCGWTGGVTVPLSEGRAAFDMANLYLDLAAKRMTDDHDDWRSGR